MRWLAWMPAIVAAVMMAACGGGGGGGSTTADSTPPASTPSDTNPTPSAPGTTTTSTTTPDFEVAATVASVHLFDMVAGTERLLGRALLAPGQTVNCATGTVSKVNTSSSTFVVTANNCVLWGTQPLVYDGTWVFQTTLDSSGTTECTNNASCSSMATVDTSNARFGYGTANEPVVGGVHVTQFYADSASNSFLGLPSVSLALPNVGTLVFNGASDNFTVDLNGRRIATIRGGAGYAYEPRHPSPLTTQAPINASLLVDDPGVRGLIDRNADLVVDRSLFVNWADVTTAGSTSQLLSTITSPASTLTFAATPAPVAAADPDAVAARQAVIDYDMVAGTERLMGRSPVDILAPTGTTATRACATGSVTGSKTSATTYVLTANNCVLWGTDPVVYNGTWNFQITQNTFAADGTCANANGCQLDANIDTTAARFGYGTATRPVVPGVWERKTTAAGSTQYVLLQDVPWTMADGTSVTLRGNSHNFHADPAVFGTGFVSIVAGSIPDPAGTPKRPPLAVRYWVPAHFQVQWLLPVDTGIRVLADDNFDLVVDRSFLVPWSDFAP